MKYSSLVSLLAIGILLLSHCHHAAADTTIILIFITPEFQAVDADGNGIVTLAECMAATLTLFPQEDFATQTLIAQGCMNMLAAQQKNETSAQISQDTDIEVAVPSDPSVAAPAPTEAQQKRVFAQTFKDRLSQFMGQIKQGASKYREEYIHSRWLLNKAKEHKKAVLASLFFIFVPLYAMGYFTRLHLFVGSVITTARNLFKFSGKEGRDSYLLWSVTVALLIVLIEAFSIFNVVLPKLTAARAKLGFRETNWAQFFNGTSRASHALVWLLMTSATIRRVRSTGFPVWAVVPFFLMAFSVDVNDVLEFAGLYTNVDNHSSTVKYLLNATSYIATIGYSVTFTAGIVILLFVLPEAEETVPDEKSQVNIVQAHVNESGQFFTVATVPSGIVKTIKLLAMGSERAENVIPAILSFFFHGIGYLFQGRFLKFAFTLAVSSAIWYDFYALNVVGSTVGEFTSGWLDLSNQANSASTNILSVLKSFADQDHPKISSLYWHTVIFFAFHLASTLDVLSYTRKLIDA